MVVGLGLVEAKTGRAHVFLWTGVANVFDQPGNLFLRFESRDGRQLFLKRCLVRRDTQRRWLGGIAVDRQLMDRGNCVKRRPQLGPDITGGVKKGYLQLLVGTLWSGCKSLIVGTNT